MNIFERTRATVYFDSLNLREICNSAVYLEDGITQTVFEGSTSPTED